MSEMDKELEKILKNIKVERELSPSLSVKYDIINLKETILQIKSLFKKKTKECVCGLNKMQCRRCVDLTKSLIDQKFK